MTEIEGKEAPRELTTKWAYLTLFCTSPVLIAVALLGYPQRAFGAWMCSGFVMLAVRTRWDLRRHVWFWVTILFAIIIQTPFVVFIPWNSRHLSGAILLPIAVLEYCLVLGCVKLAEKLVGRWAGGAS